MIHIQILCWELVSKRGGAWILHYVKSAYAVTDVPDQVRAILSDVFEMNAERLA